MSKQLDELRAAAEAEFAAKRAADQTPEPVVPAPVVDDLDDELEIDPVPADPAPVPDPPPPAPDPEPKPGRREVYRKVVDLGDGKPQVFTASTKDELIEKLFTAQTNASKRINELKSERQKLLATVEPDPEQPNTNYKPRTLSNEEELEIANDLQSNPSGALAKALEAILGAPLSEVRQTLADVKRRDEVMSIGKQFIERHPEYPVTAQNEKLMGEYIQKNKLAWTLKNLELAFADLQEAGLVTAKGDEPVTPVEEIVEEVPAVVEPPAPPAPVVPAPAPTTSVEQPRRRRAVVGISSRQSAAAAEPEAPHEASVDDLLKLSPAERRRIVQAQYSRQA